MFWKKWTWYKQFSNYVEKRNRTYIIPSAQGLKFSFLLIVLLLMGLIYNNNLTLGLSFILSSWLVVVMHLTHENIRGIRILRVELISSFAEQEAEIEIEFESSKWFDEHRDIQIDGAGFLQTFSLPSGKKHTLRFSTQNFKLHRGLHENIRLKFRSDYPFGLLRPWKVWVCNEPWIIPPSRIKNSTTVKNKIHDDDREFNSYESGFEKKPGQLVDWKMTSIRHEFDQQTLMLRDFQSFHDKKILLDWTAFEEPAEERLQLMTSLIYEAHKSGIPFHLKLLNWESGDSTNKETYEKCLEQLALFKI